MLLCIKDQRRWSTKPRLRKGTTVPVPAGEKEVRPEACQCASFYCECDYKQWLLNMTTCKWGGSGLRKASGAPVFSSSFCLSFAGAEWRVIGPVQSAHKYPPCPATSLPLGKISPPQQTRGQLWLFCWIDLLVYFWFTFFCVHFV